VGQLADAALGCGVAPLVRVRSVDDPDVAVLLDNGATGIVFPDVSSPEAARRGGNAAKVPPVGRRSDGGGYPQLRFRPTPVAEATAALNDSTLVVCMIETPEGLDNAETIAAVEGVDVLHVGMNDLLLAMGKPGKFGDPQIVAAVERVIAAARKHGKFA